MSERSSGNPVDEFQRLSREIARLRRRMDRHAARAAIRLTLGWGLEAVRHLPHGAGWTKVGHNTAFEWGAGFLGTDLVAELKRMLHGAQAEEAPGESDAKLPADAATSQPAEATEGETDGG